MKSIVIKISISMIFMTFYSCNFNEVDPKKPECTIGDSETRIKYMKPVAESCQSENQTRICSNQKWGNWNGTFVYENCKKKSNPVNFLFEIHMHNMAVLDNRDTFNNIGQCMLKLGNTFKNHGIKVAWGVMEYYAKAVRKFESKEKNLFRKLEEQGHEIGMHSLNGYDQNASSILIDDLGFKPKYAQIGMLPFGYQFEVFKDVFLDLGYKIFGGDFNNFLSDGHWTHAWQPIFDGTSENFIKNDPESDILAISHHGYGWVGSNDVDTATKKHFDSLQTITPMDVFVSDAQLGKTTVYSIAVHDDLFTSGQKMINALEDLEDQEFINISKEEYWHKRCLQNDCVFQDTMCSDSAIKALDDYLTNTIDPLKTNGTIISKTYSEIYDIYTDTSK